MKRKIVSLGLSALLVLTLFGCGSSKTDDVKPSGSPSATPSANPSASPSDSTSAEETAVTGKVTSVDGSKIVIDLLEGTSSADIDNSSSGKKVADSEVQADGTKPAPETKPAANTSAPTPADPEKPIGSSSADPQDTELPGGADVLQPTGASKTITVMDSTEIFIEKSGSLTAGTITDISVGAVITVTMKGESVTSITVLDSAADSAAGPADSDSTGDTDTNGNANNSGSTGASVKPGASTSSESAANPAAAGVRPAPAA